jgi:hypothetical protein
VEPLTDREIRAALSNASRSERAAATLPDLATLDWAAWDVLGWRDVRAPQRGYLIAPGDDGPIGIALRAPDGSVARAAQCQVCHYVHKGTVALFAAKRGGAAGRNGNTMGAYLCDGLDCSLRMRQAIKPTKQRPDTGPEIAARGTAITERASAFIASVLAG